MRGSYRCAHGLYGRFIERREAGDEDKVMAGGFDANFAALLIQDLPSG
jgi:hypothetical protein